jgi:hypothetical protein
MDDTTKLEGIFQDVKDSVDRLEFRIGGVEHRIAAISEKMEDRTKRQIVLSIPAYYITIVHVVLGVIIALVVLQVVSCIRI